VAELFLSRRCRGIHKVARTALIRLWRATLQWHFGNAKKNLFMKLLLSSQFWPMPSMSRGMINYAKQFLSHPFSRIKSLGQWAVDQEPVLTATTSAKIGKTAIRKCKACISTAVPSRPAFRSRCRDTQAELRAGLRSNR